MAGVKTNLAIIRTKLRRPPMVAKLVHQQRLFNLLDLRLPRPLTLVSAPAGAASEKDFEVQSTENILNLCTTTPDDPLYRQAINFCHGFLVGAYRYYEAAGSGPAGLKLVCLPDPPPVSQ